MIKALLVEDDIPSVKVIMHYLKDGYEVDHAIDGTTALRMISEKEYSVILLDIDLGIGMTGLDVLNRIRKNPEFKGTPVIAVTAYAMAVDRERFLNSGFTDYISKPFSKNELLFLLKNIPET